MTDQNNQAQGGNAPEFAILRIYMKDASFETPHSPKIFKEDWKPEISLQLNTRSALLENDLYEVVLNVTTTATMGEKTAFLAEIQQAGIYSIKGMSDAQRDAMLGAYCPNTLFPFAREAISDLVIKGGFPQFLLKPVNFDAIYQQKLAEQEQSAAPTKGH